MGVIKSTYNLYITNAKSIANLGLHGDMYWLQLPWQQRLFIHDGGHEPIIDKARFGKPSLTVSAGPTH